MKVEQEPNLDLSRAEAALARRDLLTAAQSALRAVGKPWATPAERCRAYRVLTLTAIQLDSPQPALSYALAGSLIAQREGDEALSRQAEEVLGYVLAKYPNFAGTNEINEEQSDKPLYP